jgi:OPA family glycerol-3-phosphate transporter-like MFS transporter/OPA family sugar phosphate sensor protein UhpC-like MFS transporter
MEKDLGLSKSSLGLFLTLQDILYGVSKFFNGFLGDQANPRFFMAVGLIASAILNILFGVSSNVLAFGLFWMFNGWFQGMGFPPCARVLSHWFSPSERGTKWGIWNSSHQVGAAIILVMAGYLVHYGWRACFIVPALIAIAAGFFIAERLRDTPGSLGLPPVEKYMGEDHLLTDREKHQDGKEFRAFLMRHVFRNPYIWLISLANFFVYVLRYAIMNWAPSYLQQTKGMPAHQVGWMLASFEIFGIIGSLAAGWITDTFFKSRRAPVCVFYMVASVAFVILLWKCPPGATLRSAIVLSLAGFFVYGPQFLVGVMTADIATKCAAATAIGLTGFFGYLSGFVSGWGLGWLVQHHGWDAGFTMLQWCGVLSAALFALCWKAKPAHHAD